MSAGRTNFAVAIAAVVFLALGIGIGFVIAPVARSPDPSDDARSPPDAVDLTRVVRPQPNHAAAGTSSSAPPRATAPVRTETAHRPRVTTNALTASEVRRIVAEELARFDREGPGPVPPPEPANPALNGDPSRRSAVIESVRGLRQIVVSNDMQYRMGSGEESRLRRPDPSRVDLLGDERVWPANTLGWIERDPERYEILGEGAEGFDPTRDHGAWVFTERLDRNIATEHAVTLVFERGVAPDAIVTLQSGGSILCNGDFAGRLVLDGYTTVVIEGSLSGSIVSASYTSVFVREQISGSFTSTSYANVRAMGGISGKMDLFDGNNVYVGGYTRMSVVQRWAFRDRASVTLEGSDLAPGNHAGPKRVTVIVLEP